MFTCHTLYIAHFYRLVNGKMEHLMKNVLNQENNVLEQSGNIAIRSVILGNEVLTKFLP